MLPSPAWQYKVGRGWQPRTRPLLHRLRPQATAAEELFNRDAETTFLKKWLAKKPVSVTLIVGPRSAGKTAFFKNFMEERELIGSRCYIDCRAVDASSPMKLANALVKLGLPRVLQNVHQLNPQDSRWQSLTLLTGLLSLFSEKMKSEGSELTLNMNGISAIVKEFMAKETTGDLPAVTDLYQQVLAAWDAAADAQDAKYPVLVLDEANVLMDWGEEHQADLKALLRFFTAVTKQNKRAHVVLSTSEYSFITWLQEGLGPSVVDSYSIGEFSEVQARQFLDKDLLAEGGSAVNDQDWREIYTVCGGNAGFLTRVAAAHNTGTSWMEAMEKIADAEDITFDKATQAGPASGYTKKDVAQVIGMILSNKYKGVPYKYVQRQVGNEALSAMVKANLLGIRPYSAWAEDIDPGAFSSKHKYVVTAPTRMLLNIWQTSENVQEMLTQLSNDATLQQAK